MGTPPVTIACIMQAEALSQSKPPAACCPITSGKKVARQITWSIIVIVVDWMVSPQQIREKPNGNPVAEILSFDKQVVYVL